ncbi:MAG TPA: type IIL restriction-modification enzyme MmeI [Candidatus Obscuribacterales bacterium]
MPTLPPNVPMLLDGRPVEKITAFLFAKGGHDDPHVLVANKNKSFQGSIVLGMGFTFDDSNPDATSIEEMHRLIEKDPRNAERIFPYIGGEEVNSSPTHAHHRYVINFGEMSETEARQWKDLMAIVEEKVKPARLAQKREIRARYWWRFGETTPALVRAIAECDRVLVISRIGNAFAFTFLPSGVVYNEKIVVFPMSHSAPFCILQSRVHEAWTRFFSSTLKDDLQYTPSKCFETFPFPENWETDPTLEAIGKTYYDYRADLMVRNNQGLTDTYNRFHDPEERDPDILHLRHLHEQMDRAVLAAYGWPDIDTTCGFALDYLDTDDDLPPVAAERMASGDLFFPTADEAAAFDSLVRTGRRKLPWRYKWPEATHDEVLARLLDLNQQRHLEEVRGHKAAEQKAEGKKPKRGKSKPDAPTIPGMEV